MSPDALEREARKDRKATVFSAGLAGLAFPIVVALITVIVGSVFLKDQHNESIWAEVQPAGNPTVSSAART